MNGRQATLERGDRKLRRETQKFKRFFERSQPSENRKEVAEDNDEWEEGSARKEASTTEQSTAQTTTAATMPDETGPTETTASNDADSSMTAGEDTENPPQERPEEQGQTAESRRTSNRERRARNMYGDWDTSQRRHQRR